MAVTRTLVKVVIGTLAMVSYGTTCPAAGDFDTTVMMATLKVTNSKTNGTAIIVTRPDQETAGKVQSILVTADHVFSGADGEDVTLHYRKKTAGFRYAKAPSKIKIRQNGKPLWVSPPGADVAAIEITPPPDVDVPGIPIAAMATDADLDRLGVHPGELIRCVGYPFANFFEADSEGFGVVRLGCIAGRSLRPTHPNRTFLCDLNSFGGDSGSPIYLSEDRKGPDGTPAHRILGLNVGQHNINEEYHLISESGKRTHRIGIIIVYHATTILDTIALLPRHPSVEELKTGQYPGEKRSGKPDSNVEKHRTN